MHCKPSMICLLLLAGAPAAAAGASAPLFESAELLELTLPVDFDALCRPSEDPECDFERTRFEYRAAGGARRTVPVEIRRRDGWRAQQTNCQVPTLFVRFAADDVVDTPFEGQSTLALTSHCGKGIATEAGRSPRLPDRFESYVINEYLGYRLYQQVSEASLRVRLARIQYEHPDNPRRGFTHYGFFAEHFESLAERLGATLVTAGEIDPRQLDAMATTRMALFQYMVGNTDWSLPALDNVIVLRFPDGRELPVPYDLDMSGLVSAHYARPSEGLPITSVRERHYLGQCYPDLDWGGLFARFSDLREPMMAELAATPGLGRGERRRTGVYLDGFFETLDSPALRQENIVEACRPWPPSAAAP